jgi:hypothetical protein
MFTTRRSRKQLTLFEWQVTSSRLEVIRTSSILREEDCCPRLFDQGERRQAIASSLEIQHFEIRGDVAREMLEESCRCVVRLADRTNRHGKRCEEDTVLDL